MLLWGRVTTWCGSRSKELQREQGCLRGGKGERGSISIVAGDDSGG